MSGVAPGTPPATTAAGTRRMVGSVLAVLLIVLASACGTSRDDGDPAARRGEVVSVTALSTMTDAETAAYLGERQLETPVRNGVETYRIVYRTVGPLGEETTASGLMVLPRTETERLRVVSYAHGTIVRKDEAPSADGETDRARAIMFAAVGNAAVAPDYLGLGEGPGRHPYAHA
ncbi:alpha/beta hydrolase, partial [Nocardia elegans]|nr:alpha/beta hydrolase [Nocardia elegans]